MTRELLAALVMVAFAASPVRAQQPLVLGYVLDRPLPVLAGVADGEFTESVGIGASWRAFDNEPALLQALAAGDVALAIGIGPETFLDGLSAGQDLKLVDIAGFYPGQGACVLRNDIAESGASLYGLRVALPYGTGLELAFNRQMAALGADAASAVRRDLASVDAAAALARGDTDIACGDGVALRRLREYGVELMAVDQVFALGLRWFGAVVVTAEFAERQPGVIIAYLQAQGDLSGDLAAIALAADMGEIDAEAALAAQQPLSAEKKLGGDWLRGGLAQYLTDLATLRAERALLSSDPAAVASHVDPSFLQATGP